MSNCDNCPSKEGCTSQENCTIENNPYNHIKCVIGVMSGKGGVGKSTISTMLARTLNVRGHSVGIMDADITGPSIPRLLSIENTKVRGSELGIIPVKSPEGIEVISLNLFMEDEEQPVIWRGPLIAGAVKQFWTDVLWGNLDYLIIDLPPGTGDVALTVMQSIPINGMVMVSTPQDMVSMIVAKSINMVKTMNIPILGVVENMSYMICPQCGKKIDIFGDSNIDIFLDRQDIKLLGKLPMSKDLASVAENNENNMQNDIINTFNSIIDKIDSSLNL
ncbi:MAG TPA: Mrp/NBP35 family ATP-binding protein [Clostridiales bacterium]|nr:Mrp/NBP35 family ATP-binding protein [Clostridiales bacterium]